MHRLAALIPRRGRIGGPREGCSVEKNTPASHTRAHSNYADKLGGGGKEKKGEEGKRVPWVVWSLHVQAVFPYASCCWKGKKKRAPDPTPSTLTLASIATIPCVSLTFAIFFGLSTLCKITSSPPFLYA